MKKRCFRPYAFSKINNETQLITPLTFMNNSGKVLPYLNSSYNSIEEVVVVCDTLDLPPGMIRIRKGGSSAGHNGLKSLIAVAQSSDFIRIYVGIGRPTPPSTVIEHVLTGPTEDEEKELLQQGIKKAASAVIDLVENKPIQEVINVYNRRNTS